MTQVLILEEVDLVARGMQRDIYLHPTDTTKLVKVLRKNPDTVGRSGFGNFMEKHFPMTRARHIRKEYTEYLRVMLSNREASFHIPITHMFGFAHTQFGLGCVTERVTTRSGALAKTLETLIRHEGITPRNLDLLNDTTKRLYQLDIRASDLTAKNLVFGRRNGGPKECVLVDGFGDIHAVPVRSMAGWSNRIGLDDSFKRLAQRTHLSWNGKTRQFAKAA
ncbi:YrbL family protein [Cognatiyoonia sp. IB215446]|uniref:YrbL family protein n=1 Tax=Cognatiyoonia sp. IB215446 TaxID=3097355 RepID=UPI002A0C53FD|nr:YrbL family protein [Cognatiyoonia sp. IB215446]MDX8346761.1 YrbL family protein [Cognatiyoonia sp. IB215446]